MCHLATSTRFRGTGYGIYWHGVRGSVRLRTREFHYLCPLLGFVSDELAEFGERHRHRHAAQISEPRLDRGIGEAGVNCLVELVDDLGGRVLGNADAIPEARFVARQELSHGRDVGQRVRARRGGYCERTQPASPDILDPMRQWWGSRPAPVRRANR